MAPAVIGDLAGAAPTPARTAAALAYLAAVAPLDAALTSVSSLTRGRRAAERRPTSNDSRTVLLTGGKMTKALHLARAFGRAGHRVVLAETARYRWTAHRFSREVDAFHVVDSPGSPSYAHSLARVVRSEDVDVVVPACSPASSLPDAEARTVLDEYCEVVHPTAEQVRRVDDKYEFAQLAQSLGLGVPDTHRVTAPGEVVALLDRLAAEGHLDDGRRYVLKSIAYDPVRRLDLTPLPRASRSETSAFVQSLPITEDNPWILQELVEGDEYCTHGTVRGGRLRAYVCCRSSAFQLSYAPVEHAAIREWVERFVAGTGLTGQLSFDLIERADGSVVAIECNPRPHSAITLFEDSVSLADAYLEDGETTLEPPLDTTPTYWLHHELWNAALDPTSAPERLRRITSGRDAVLDPHDPLPFLLLHHLHLPALLVDSARRGESWLRIDPNIGKLVQPAGD